MAQIDGSKKTGPKCRVEIDGLKQTSLNGRIKEMGQNRQVQIYGFLKDGFKKLSQTYRSLKKKCHKNCCVIKTEILPKIKCHQN